jgi:GH15 family glucan-1,4-alpha-glucosidase
MASFSLEDYGVIGNFSSAALVNRVGSIDWACLPYLDSPSHFTALLDDTTGGRFQISPHGDFRSEQRYHQRTLVLETLFETPFGRAVLTDWMPLSENSAREPLIYRQVDMIEGKINWVLACNPRFDYGSIRSEVEFHGAREGEDGYLNSLQAWSPHRVLFRGNEPGQIAQLFSSMPVKYSIPKKDIHGNANRFGAEAKFTLSKGESVIFAWAWGRRIGAPPFQSFKSTTEQWRKLAHSCPNTGCAFAGPWHDAVTRSGLFLKLLIAPYSGSIAEAVTTSIPGIIRTYADESGAVEIKAARTWDYRYAWIRHGSMAMQALTALGYKNEAKNYFSWLSEIVIRDGIDGLQAVYTLDGGKQLAEKELGHLRGFHGAKPVRIGNQSSEQYHLDIYGHVMLAADHYYREFGELPEGLWNELVNIADLVCHAWKKPDFGAWELRAKAEHHVSSKVLCWAALDRAVSLSKRMGKNVPNRWIEEMKILHRTIINQGFNQEQNSFVRAFGETTLDASSLWIPITGFLPFDDPMVVGTMSAIITELSEGVLVRKYQIEDVSPGQDGPHLHSSFLLISALALAGRVDEASDRLAELCTYATHLGIFGEQVDPLLEETSGNFPSATSHLSLINAALYVASARGRQIPTFLLGSRAAAVGTRIQRKSA